MNEIPEHVKPLHQAIVDAIAQLAALDPASNTAEGVLLSELVSAVEAYERKRVIR